MMTNSKPKVLILQGVIASYRVPIFNIIAEQFDLTVAYYLKDGSKAECKFKKQNLKYNQIGPFVWIKSLRKYCNQFDVVIFPNDLHIPCFCLLPFGYNKYKAITWGIGLRASYTRLYDTTRKHTLLDKITQCIYSVSDASIFYMEKAKEFWRKTSLDLNKVFVAINTTAVIDIEQQPLLKNSLLFVGTLYKEKGLYTLLSAYKEAAHRIQNIPVLNIVGDGDEAQELKQFVVDNKLAEKVFFHGAIFEESILSSFFQKALLCISPNQAGLSVAKSMGYGVPFVTYEKSITGGERYHISHGVNGLLYEKDADLVDIIVDVSTNSDKYIEMGAQAKSYYENNATPQHMAQGAIDAINYVLNR